MGVAAAGTSAACVGLPSTSFEAASLRSCVAMPQQGVAGMERLGRGQATRWRKKKSRVQVDAVVRHPLDSEGKSASVVVRMPQPGVAGMERLARGQAIRWRKKTSSQVDAVVHHPLDSEDASASTNAEENVNGALAHGVIALTLKEEVTKNKDESNHVHKSKVTVSSNKVA